MNINPHDFDINKFIHNESLIPNSEDIDILENLLNKISRVPPPKPICLVADPSTGVDTFLDKYKNNNTNSVFIVSCRSQKIQNIFGDLMTEIGFGHRMVNWYDTPLSNIIDA